jgi:ferredoxin--NADP+ reductase
VDTILGARSQDLLCLEDEMRAASERLWVTTDDGSYGRKGLVVAPLQRLLEGEKPKMVLCAGPLPVMRAGACCR